MRSLKPSTLLVLLVVLAAAACTEKPEQAKAPAPLVVPPVATAQTDASFGPAPPPATGMGAIESMELLADNTLAIGTKTQVVTIDATGTVRRYALKGDAMPKLDAGLHGDAIVVEGKNVVTILKSPTLDELWSGAGTPLAKPHGGVGTTSSAYFMLGGALQQLPLPPGAPRSIDTVEVTNDKKFAVVTLKSDDGHDTALAFDLTTKKSTGTAQAMSSYDYATKALLVGDTQIALTNGYVMLNDLATGQTTHKQKVCNNLSFGNVMLSPAGDLLLVTCGDDGLALDPKTFAVKRRFVKILPGCDNGDTLPAHFDAKKKSELVVEGCGGEARLDTTTGKYRCSDGKELVGAPYPGMMMPGERTRLTIPSDRLSLPRCTAAGAEMKSFVGGSSQYWYGGTDEAPEIKSASGSFTIEAGASTPLISADESRLAYELKDRVLVRSLPDGKILAELRR